MKRLKGFTLIELLIVVAIIAILAAIAVPNFLEAQTRAKVSRVKSDQRSLATALEAYYIDNNSYPAFDDADYTANNDAPSANTGIGLTGLALTDFPSFRVKDGGTTGNDYDPLATLTTPVSYITSYFVDAFPLQPGQTFWYGPGGNLNGGGSCWLLSSNGPNIREDLYTTYNQTVDLPGNNDCYIVTETTYSCFSADLSAPLSIVTYDPTNGTTSFGDVWRQKQ